MYCGQAVVHPSALWPSSTCYDSLRRIWPPAEPHTSRLKASFAGHTIHMAPRASPAGQPRGAGAAFLVCQHSQEQQRDDVGDLDHRIDGWAGGILVGITNGVTGHRGLVGIRALAAEVSVFDVLLGVVPCPSTGRHGDSDKKTSNDHAEQHGAKRSKSVTGTGYGADHIKQHNWGEQREERGHDHFADRRTREHVDRARVV